MLLYKVTYQTQMSKDDHVALHKKWIGSKEASANFRALARQRRGYIPNSIQTEKIVVPTKKDELIKFLNSNFVL